MKKILQLLTCLMLTIQVFAQQNTAPTFYMMIDGVRGYSSKKVSLSSSDYIFTNPYIGHTFGKKGRFGIFVEGVIESDVFSINPGLMIAFQPKTTYHEFGIGPGFEFPRTPTEERTTYLNFYYYGENKLDNTNNFTARNKWIWNTNLSYAPNSWGLWWYTYIAYHPTKHLAIAAYSQRYVLTGPQIRLVLPVLGKNIKPTIWLAVGKEYSDTRYAIGMNVMGQWIKSKK